MMMTKDLRKNEMDDMQLCLKKALARVHKARYVVVVIRLGKKL